MQNPTTVAGELSVMRNTETVASWEVRSGVWTEIAFLSYLLYSLSSSLSFPLSSLIPPPLSWSKTLVSSSRSGVCSPPHRSILITFHTILLLVRWLSLVWYVSIPYTPVLQTFSHSIFLSVSLSSSDTQRVNKERDYLLSHVLPRVEPIMLIF